MKNLIVVSMAFIAISCTKTWECTITTKKEVNPNCEYLSDTESYYTIEIEGKKEDKKAMEAGYPDTLCQPDIFGGDCDYCIISIVNCVKK